jgi:hypothetical protein
MASHVQKLLLASSRLPHGPKSGGAKIGAHFVTFKWSLLPVKSQWANKTVTANTTSAAMVGFFIVHKRVMAARLTSRAQARGTNQREPRSGIPKVFGTCRLYAIKTAESPDVVCRDCLQREAV